MSLPTLKYIVLKLEVTNCECNVESTCWAVKHYLKNDELAKISLVTDPFIGSM